ncbi:hypothetical protein BJ546DRAFT_128030 [Cryomyces antarcticus]
MTEDSRLAPCYLLHESGVPCVVWFEDALAYYGVPTALFQLYILVLDIEAAAQSLVRRGWIEVVQQQSTVGNATFNGAQRCLTPPGYESQPDRPLVNPSNTEPRHPRPRPPPPSSKPPGPTKTLLLLAAEWNYSLLNHTTKVSNPLKEAFFPPLAGLLDALIDSLLDAPFDNDFLQRHLVCYISYLYMHVPLLKDPSFARFLKADHRQYHLDSLSGMNTGSVAFISHQIRIREAIRNGTYQQRECSATRDDESLFTDKSQAKLLAQLNMRRLRDSERNDA